MSNRIEIRVPDIGDFDRVPVIEILVAEGDTVAEEQSLITLESDKATMEVPATAAGRVVSLAVSEGDEVSEGDVIAVVESGETAAADDEASPEAASESPPEAAASAPAEEQGGSADASGKERETESPSAMTEEAPSGSAVDAAALPAPPVPFAEMGRDPSSIPHASPAVRKLARELGVELGGVSGSGDHGRITAEDLKLHVKQRMTSSPESSSPKSAAGGGMSVAAAPEIDFSKFGDIDVQPLSRIQKISGPNLHRNWVTIPHVTQFDEADITEMEAFRKASAADADAVGAKMTPLVFLIKAVVAALRKYPKFNASLSSDGTSLVWKKYFHVAVAVDTPNGLVVPVVRDADRFGLLDLAQALAEISSRARDGKLSREDMQGGSMTISSLGGIGGTAFTPIINAPEVAILGVSRAEMKPVWTGEKFKPRRMLPLSLSYDHRVIDGADAARFTRYVAHVLGDVRRLLL